MAKVFLRVYDREIESMIEGGQLDEAVAHCQHILKTYPMHIDTYRLLGKAFLEARRYADAADIFQRVLMAVPDDFVSHVGMSIIRDDENKMDDAIWHMERAFEVQPSNSAIQGELRRLYGRRDGVEPSKIRLSRDALANMYSQGELFNQAIAEIRSVLAEDTDRPDLQVMLARAYYRSGQKVEAAEMAAVLLKKYPYCMDSLRVLVDVLPGTGRAENTQVYRQRLQNLDPYSSFAPNSVFASDQVADSSVNLDKLDYKSDTSRISSQPDWASSLGIKVNEEKRPETPPEWMQTGENPEQMTASKSKSSGSSTTPAPAGAVDSIPEWMHSAGWHESTKNTQEGSNDSGESLPEEKIAKADIPDWLKPMAPKEIDEEVNPESEEDTLALAVGEDGIPEWLKPAGTIEPVEGAQLEEKPPIEPQPAREEDIPEWLKSMEPVNAAEEVQAEPPLQPAKPPQMPVEPQAASTGEIAEMLPSMKPVESTGEGQAEAPVQPLEQQQLPVEPQPANNGEIPEWLKSLAPGEAAEELHIEAPMQPVEPQQLTREPEQAAAGEVPDWLKSMAPTEAVEKEIAETPAQPVEPQQVISAPEKAGVDEIPDWLKSLASTDAVGDAQVEEQEPVESKQEQIEPQPIRAEGVPDWLQPIEVNKAPEGEDSVAAVKAVEPQPESAGGIPDWFKSLVPTAEFDDLHIEAPQPPVEPQLENEGGIPDLLGSIPPAEPTEVQDVDAEPAPTKPPSEEFEPGPNPVETPAPAAEAFPDWLTGVGSRADAAAIFAKANQQPVTNEQPGSEIPVPTEPVAQAPANPTISAPGTSSKSFKPTGEAKPLNIEDDAFSWLESLAAKQGAKPEELLTNPRERSGEMPDWLRQHGEEPTDMTVPPAQEPILSPSEPLPLEPLSWFNAAPVSKPDQGIEDAFPSGDEKPLSELPVETSAQPADQPIGNGDDTLAWLEKLDAEHEPKTEEPEVSAISDLGATPDWIQKVEDEQPVVSAAEEVIPAQAEPAQAEEDLSVTSWLNRMDVQDELKEKPVEVPEQAAPTSSAEELPDWLKGLEKPDNVVEAPQKDEDLPEWLHNPLPSETTEQVVPTLGLDSAAEPEIPSWMDETVSLSRHAAPTMPEEWMPAETRLEATSDSYHPAESIPGAKTTSPADSLSKSETTQSGEDLTAPASNLNIEAGPVKEEPPAVETKPKDEIAASANQIPYRMPTLKQTGMLSRIPSQDKDSELLSRAQDVLDQDSLDDAMKLYSKLIKKSRLLDEVIHDLREAIYRYPVDVIIWQTLGDAYMRTNRLQDALDAYTKAEELLR